MARLWHFGALCALFLCHSGSPAAATTNGSSQQAAEALEEHSAEAECLPGPLRLDNYLPCQSAADHDAHGVPLAPWTHRPYCGENTNYCVFTNANFRSSSRGVSIIDIPSSNASDVTSTVASISDLLLTDDPTTEQEPPPYELQDIPGKGKGLVATRKISRGQTFLVDYAALVADTKFPSRVKRDQGRQLLREAVHRLPAADLILDLARSSSDPDNVPAAEDVLKTNSFSVDIGGKSYMALFPHIARINHACKPSALTRFNSTTLSNTVTAFHDILPGEEITISYSPFGLTSQARQQTLLQKWGFRCTCPLCSASPSVLAASDARRQKIAVLGEEVIKMLDRGEAPKRAAEMYEEVVEAVKEEGLVPHLGAHYEVLGRLYLAAGDKKKGVDLVRKGVEESRGFEGVF
ncbi:SET domain-containing protein 5 [Madurella mycetomatis]|uniref:SET domain-containing protein 5 n=1 Tax=Madurella mycetomatis TaxID=100816 RepID=A0A175W3N7_9PEZI|nr:SET domain-containing protein 5 [Madurella mycetomatis]